MIKNPEAYGPLTYVWRFIPPLDVSQFLQEKILVSIAHVYKMGRHKLHLVIKGVTLTDYIMYPVKDHPEKLEKLDNMKICICTFYASFILPIATPQ